MAQSVEERKALHAVWAAQTKVRQFHDAMVDYARENGLQFDAAGLTRVMGYASVWLGENGPLPDSGVLAG